MNIKKNNKKMLTSDNFSLQESFNDNDINDLKNKISYNEKAIKEFESHLRSLLTIAKESELDYAFQVQKGLEKIKYIEDNVTSKRLLLKEYKKGEELEKEINKLNKEIEENNNVLKNNEKGKAIIEKHQHLKIR